MRQKFWKDQHIQCERCQEQPNSHSHGNESDIPDENIADYRRLYIKNNLRTPSAASFWEDMSDRQSYILSPMPSTRATRATVMSMSSINVVPSRVIQMRTSRITLPSIQPNNSMLVRAYEAQQQISENFPFRVAS